MTKLKVRRIGNSLGAILPTEVLRRLRVGEGDELFVVEDDEGVAAHAVRPPTSYEALEAFEEGRKRYRNALRRLAQ